MTASKSARPPKPADGDRSCSRGAFDTRQSGPRARQGFRYQDQCVALKIVEGLIAGDLHAVDVELSTDVVVHRRDGSAEYVSVKSRNADHSHGEPWGWAALNDAHVLRDLYRHWRRNGQQGSATVWTNSGLTRAAKRDLYEPNSPSDPSVIARVARHIDADPDSATDFLAAFVWPRYPLPRPAEMNASLQEHVRRWAQNNGFRVDRADDAVEAIVAHVRSASEADVASVPHSSARSAAEQIESDIRGLRRINATDISDLLTTFLGANTPNPDLISIFPQPNPQFAGPRTQLEEINEYLRVDGRSPACRPIVLSGPVGVGKTTLALEAAAAYPRPSDVFLVDASQQESATAALRAIDGLEREHADSPQETGEAVQPLVLVDGVTDSTVLASFTGRIRSFPIVITSTVAAGGSLARPIRIAEWSGADAVSFLRAQVGQSQIEDEVVAQFGGNPLVLSQICAACQVEGIGLDAYWKQYGDNPDVAMTVGQVDDPLLALGVVDHARQPAAAAITHTLTALRAADPVAYESLAILTVCGPTPVDRTRLSTTRVAMIDGTSLQLVGRTFPIAHRLDEPTLTPAAAAAVLHRLAALSLVRLVGRHVLVHAAQRHILLHTLRFPHDPLRIALGSFIGDNGDPELGVRQAQQAVSALDNALRFGFNGQGLHLMSLTYVGWAYSSGLRDCALRLVAAAETWFTSVAAELPVEARMALQRQLVEFYAMSNYRGSYLPHVRELIRLAELADHHATRAWALHQFSKLASTRPELIDECVSRLPPAESLATETIQTRSRFVLARAILDSRSGHTARAITCLESEEAALEPFARQGQYSGLYVDVLTLLARMTGAGFTTRAHESIRWATKLVDWLHVIHGADAELTTAYASASLDVADGYLGGLDTIEAAKWLIRARAAIVCHHADNPLLVGMLSLLEGRLALEQFNQDLGDKHQLLASSEDSLRKGIDILRELPAAATPALSSGWVHLAWVLMVSGSRLDEAVDAATRSIAHDREHLAEDHPEVLDGIAFRAMLVHLREATRSSP